MDALLKTDPTSARHAVVETALGPLTVVADEDGLVGLYYPEHRPAPDPSTFGDQVDVASDALLTEAAAQLDDYLAGRRHGFDVPLHLRGTERARAVWGLIAAIPYGSTLTYKALGEQAGGIGPRAVGGFVARNPVSVVIGCHRVVGSDGSLTGYAGGLERKRRLLELEGVLAPALVAS